MGYNYEQPNFTSEPFELLPQQITPSVGELQPQSIYYIRADDVTIVEVIDEVGETKFVPYVYRHANLLESDDVVDEMVDCFDEEDIVEYVRIAGLNDGILLDSSHTNQKTWESGHDRFTREMTTDYYNDPDNYLPVIHWVFNYDELEVIDPALQANNIWLDPREFDEDIWDKAMAIRDEKEHAIQEGIDEEDEDNA